jgi:hypothetical protein
LTAVPAVEHGVPGVVESDLAGARPAVIDDALLPERGRRWLTA